MTLLAPLSALVAGMLAFPVLVLYYMLKLRRRPLTVSSTFLWEQALYDVQANVPLRWIRPSVLFLLHALILALLVLALGRPAVESTGATSARAFFLMDCSASMASTDGPGGTARFEDAKAQALEIGRRLLSGSGRPVITIVSFAHEATIATRPVDSVRELRVALDELSPLDQPGRLGPALRLTESLFEAPTDESAPLSRPLVTVFSDGVFTDDAPLSLSGADVSLVPVRTDRAIDQGNMAIVACSAARSTRTPASIRLFVRIESSYLREKPVTLTIFKAGQPTSTHALVVPASSDLGPGTVGQSFTVMAEDGVLLTAALTATDLLESDNVASVFVPPPVDPRALLVHPEDDPANPFLRDVLEELPLRSVRVMPESTYREFSTEQVAQYFDLVVFDRVAPVDFPSVPTMSFGAWGDGIETQDAGAGDAGFILTWDRGAPELAHVTFDTVQIARLGPIAVPSSLAAIGRADELAAVRGGPAITRLQTARGTRLFIGFRLDDSNWPLQFSFPIFMLNAVERLTGMTSSDASVSYTTIEPVIVQAREADSTVRLEGPVDLTIDRATTQPGLLSLGVINRAGVYRAAGIVPPIVAVNMFSSAESQLGVSSQLVIGGRDTPRLDATVGRIEVWHYLVGAAGVLLVMEWLLYASRVRV